MSGSDDRSDTTSDGDAIDLLVGLAELGQRVARAMAGVVNDPDVFTNSTSQVLIHLHVHGPMSPSQIANDLGVLRPRVTALLNRLEDGGLIQRRHGIVPDRRVTMVALTPLGHRAIDAADGMLRHGVDDLDGLNRTVQTFLDRTASSGAGDARVRLA